MKYLWAKFSAFLLSLMVVGGVNAQSIPLAERMSEDMEDQSVWDWLTSLVENGFTLVFLVIGAIVFVVVSYGVIQKFIEWRKERIELGEFLNSFGVGVLTIVVVGVLLTFANSAVTG